METKFRETVFRTIIHNDYYACFHKVKQLNDLYGLSMVGGGTNSHNDVIDKIKQYNGELTSDEKQTLIRELKTLKNYRQKADYLESNNYIYKTEIISNIHNKATKIFGSLSTL